MATVITIHGTFSSGPEEGSQWWQIGGPFETDLRTFVRPQNGDLTILPFRWSGANSEVSRRQAASQLLELVLSLEKKLEPYCLVGHSHGGSIIAHMLSLATLRRDKLRHLSLWSTVGSPFIVLKSNALLINRLLPFEKLILFSTVVGGLLAFLLFSARSVWPRLPIDQLIACMVPAAITYLLIWRKDRLHLAHIRGGHLLAVAKAFAHNGLCVYHTDDEAINSLTSVAHARLAIFDRRFLSGISLALVLAATPLLFLVSFFATAKALAGLLGIPIPQATSITEYMDRAVGVANYVGSRYTDPILFQVFGSTWGYNMQLALLVVAFVVVCFGVFVIVGWASAVLSGILAKRLNSLATFHVAQAVYGGDEVGTTAQASSSHAFDGAGLSHKLPEYIENAIREAADSAAFNTISQLRRRIAILISSIGGHDELDSGSHFLTWDELIHTSYFRAEEMRMLLCTAISRSFGFGATERLAQGRYAPRLGDWLTSIELSRPTRAGSVAQLSN